MATTQGINFLRERVRLQEAVVASDKRLMFYTSIALGIFMTVVVGIGAYRFYLGQRVESIDDAIGTQQAALLQLEPVKQLLSERNILLSTTEDVLAKRGKGWEAIDYLYSILPEGSAVDAIHLLASDNLMEFRVIAKDVFAYKRLSEVIQSQAVAQSGYNPSMGSLSRDKTGKYALNVKLSVLAQDDAPAPVQPADVIEEIE